MTESTRKIQRTQTAQKVPATRTGQATRTAQASKAVQGARTAAHSSKKTKKVKKEKKRGGILRGLGRGVKRTLICVLALVLVAILAVGISFYFKYGKQLISYQSKANTMVRRSTTETFKASQTSLVYAADGELISRLKAEKDVDDICHLDTTPRQRDRRT